MFALSVAVTPQDDPVEVAGWLASLVEALPESLAQMAVEGLTVSGAAGQDGDGPVGEGGGAEVDAEDQVLDVPGQLDRLRSYWKSFAPRLTRMHEGLLELGYEPKVPDQRGGARLSSYLSYVDPVTGKNLGNTNSGTFTFMKKDLREELDGHAFAKIGRYASIHFDTEDKVDFILEVAARHKQE